MRAHVRKCNFNGILNGSAYAIANIKIFSCKKFLANKKKIIKNHLTKKK